MQPAIGGAATGSFAVVALYFFHVNGIAGDPYKTLTMALLGGLPVAAMAVLCVLKLAATVTSYSSGGAGGIFAPALFMGGMLGGAVGYLDVAVFHHPADSIGAFAVVGMGAVFAGIVRAPMTSVLIIFEMTGGYGLVLPADDRQHERLRPGPPLAAHAGLRSAARAGRHLPHPQEQSARPRQPESNCPRGTIGRTCPPTPAAEPGSGSPLSLLLRLHVVEEKCSQLQIRSVEVPRQRRIVGARQRAPRRAVQRRIAGPAFEHHVCRPSAGRWATP